MNTWLLSLISVAYLGFMFVVAHYAERGMWQSPRAKILIYSLALGSCGTSWAYYGTVAQVAQSGWVIAPIYVGTIGFFVLAMPLYRQLLASCKKHNITSIADYLASRYGRSSALGALITLVIFVGLIPYIALQLRAVAVSFDILTAHTQADGVTALKVTLLIAVFCIAFGTKKVFTSEQNPGLMSVVALSSIVKLVALTLVGGLIFSHTLLNPELSFWPDQRQLTELTNAAGTATNSAILSQVILGALTIFCLPRIFHLLMIENDKIEHLSNARWHLPLYLILSNLFILPIAWFGHQIFRSTHVSPDSFVLMIPMTLQADIITLVSYLGGLAAAIAMIVVATIVLSNMIANQLVTPLMLKQRLIGTDNNKQAQPMLLMIRRIGIVGVLVLALVFHQSSAQDAQLANIGLFSFVLLVQTFPALLCAMLWRKANRVGVISGICAGTLMWLYTLALPILLPGSGFISDGLFSLSWLQPQAMFGLQIADPLSHGLVISLGGNFICLIIGSLIGPSTIRDVISSDEFFVKADSLLTDTANLPKASELYELVLRFVSKQQAELLLNGYCTADINSVASQRCYDQTQHLLSGVMGGASARMLLNALGQQTLLPEVVGIASEAKEVLSFNRELLQAGIETIDTGVSVFDYDLKLVAWNNSYQRLLEYPAGYLAIGKSAEELLNYNARRGILVADDIELAIEKRLSHMRDSSTHLHQRNTKAGRVLELRGQPMTGGGYVSSITDITEHIEVLVKT